MGAPRKIIPWDQSGGNYGAGPDPWSGTPKQVEPATKFFTPRVRSPAQHMNWALAEYSGAIDRLCDNNIGAGTILGYSGENPNTSVSTWRIGQFTWHPGLKGPVFAHALNFNSTPILVASSDMGYTWSIWSPLAALIGDAFAVGYGSGSKRHNILLHAGHRATINVLALPSATSSTASLPGASGSVKGQFVHSPTNDKTYFASNYGTTLNLYSSADTDLITWTSEATRTVSVSGDIPFLTEGKGIVICQYLDEVIVRNNTSTLLSVADFVTHIGKTSSWTLIDFAYVPDATLSGVTGVFFALLNSNPPNGDFWLVASHNGTTWVDVKNFGAVSTWKLLTPDFNSMTPWIMCDRELFRQLQGVGSTLFWVFHDGSGIRTLYSNDPSNSSAKWNVSTLIAAAPSSPRSRVAVGTYPGGLMFRASGGPLLYLAGSGALPTNGFGVDI